MKTIDINFLEKEKDLFKAELLSKPASFYKEYEEETISRFFDFIFNKNGTKDFEDVEFMANPFIKIISLPYISSDEAEMENESNTQTYCDIVLKPTFFATENFYIQQYGINKDKSFLKVLFNYKNRFTVTSLITAIKKQSKEIDSEECLKFKNKFTQQIKHLLNKQVLVVC